MKKDIHPKSQLVKFKIGNDSLDISSTIHAESYVVDIDFRKHPAWNKKERMGANTSNKSVNAFMKKYSNFSLSKKS